MSKYKRFSLACVLGLSLMSPAHVFANPSGQEVQSKVVNGDAVPRGKFRFMVALLRDDLKDVGPNGFYCGGTLISPKHVLTAAHCVTDHGEADEREWTVADKDLYTAVVGMNEFGRDQGKTRRVKSITVNPKFL